MTHHVYHCESLNKSKGGREVTESTRVRPLRTSGPYLSDTIKGRKIA